MWRTWKALADRGVVGINERNSEYVLRLNPRRFYPLVDDKAQTKARAIAAGIRAPQLYALLHSEHDASQLAETLAPYRDFVIKPANGAGGDGIVVVSDRFEGRYRTAGGRMLTLENLQHHVSGILSGIYSLGGHRDSAMVEYRVTSDPIFSAISYEGVPDIRIIVLLGYPVAAMLRLPTRESSGKANLHQGAIGVGVNLATGITTGGTWHNHKINVHPDTLNSVVGVQLPRWQEFMHTAARCYEMTGMGYLGVDMVLDKDRGPMMLELNARPGLSIQIANDVGLNHRFGPVERHIDKLNGQTELPKERVALVQQLFAA